MQRLIEKIEGSGTVTSSSGEHAAVQCVLHVYQKEIPVGNMQDANATILSPLKSYEGRILPVCFFGDPELTLELRDGRKLKFSFTDMLGSIATKGALQ
jgi:hypothetical protein